MILPVVILTSTHATSFEATSDVLPVLATSEMGVTQGYSLLQSRMGGRFPYDRFLRPQNGKHRYLSI